MRSNINFRTNVNGFGIAQIRDAIVGRDALRCLASLSAFWLARHWEAMAETLLVSKRMLLAKPVAAVAVVRVAGPVTRTSRTTTTRHTGYPVPRGSVSIA